MAPDDTTDSLPPAAGVIVWFSELPEDDDYIEIAEVSLIGLNNPEDASALSEESAAETTAAAVP